MNKHTLSNFYTIFLINLPFLLLKVKVLVAQLFLILCAPMDCSWSGSSVHGILQERSRSELPFPPLGDLLVPGIEPGSSALQADCLPSEPSRKPKYFMFQSLVINSWSKSLFQKYCHMIRNGSEEINRENESWDESQIPNPYLLVPYHPPLSFSAYLIIFSPLSCCLPSSIIYLPCLFWPRWEPEDLILSTEWADRMMEGWGCCRVVVKHASRDDQCTQEYCWKVRLRTIAREISIPDSSSIGQGSATSRPRTSTSCQISGGFRLEISANKCNVLESSRNHLPKLGLCKKLSSVKPVPGAKKWGTASG